MQKLMSRNTTLTPITNEDTDDIVRWRNQSDVRENFIYRETFTRESHERWMKSRVETGEVVQFIIRDKETDKKVGSVYLRDIDYKNHKAEFGIFIGEESYRNKGFGREAAELITEYAFQHLHLHKVYLRVLASNIRAHRSYLRAGFVEEGIAKDDVFLDDKFQDVVFMAKFENRSENRL